LLFDFLQPLVHFGQILVDLVEALDNLLIGLLIGAIPCRGRIS
jgi:hypothetical protein